MVQDFNRTNALFIKPMIVLLILAGYFAGLFNGGL
ncbi:hypothetical protein BMS3Bbin10_02074 [bacterium BMS3Bbin10]|nr:hypothetical protein BMS3Bbin10_02074 [bacterium BMS3Bbin10]